MEETSVDTVEECTQDETDQIILRGKITDHCVKCKKHELYATHTIEEKTPPVVFVMASASPLTVLIAERVIKKRVVKDEFKTLRFYMLYRCQDSMCLMKHLYEAMMINWMQREAMEHQKEVDQLRMKAMHTHKVSSRRSNRRRKAKAKMKRL